MKKQAKIDSFFDAYSKRDFEGIKKVMDRRITWFFLGQHPLAGVKHGLDEVISFFDAMGEIMAVSNGKNGKVDYRRKRSLRDRVSTQHNKSYRRKQPGSLQHSIVGL